MSTYSLIQRLRESGSVGADLSLGCPTCKEAAEYLGRVEAINEAMTLGAELVKCTGTGWRWRAGRRSSLDQYGRTFKTEAEAAADFLQSREADQARKLRARR